MKYSGHERFYNLVVEARGRGEEGENRNRQERLVSLLEVLSEVGLQVPQGFGGNCRSHEWILVLY